MSTINYKTKYGADYTKIFKVSVSTQYTYSSFQPAITGPEEFLSNTTASYTISATGYEIEDVSVSNATYSYNTSTNILSISNPTSKNITITITACGLSCTLYVGGAQGGETQNTWRASWPNKGTITYTNKYNVQKVLNVASFGLGTSYGASSYNLNYYINDVLENTNIVCTSIGITIINGWGTVQTGSSTNVRFGTSSNYTSYSLTPNTTQNYTFTNVVNGTTYIIRSER